MKNASTCAWGGTGILQDATRRGKPQTIEFKIFKIRVNLFRRIPHVRDESPHRLDLANQSPNLEQLFTESAGDLERYFSRRHGVGEIVQDLVQETFLQMARGLRDGRKFKCARGYLFGIARHLSQAAWTQHKAN